MRGARRRIGSDRRSMSFCSTSSQLSLAERLLLPRAVAERLDLLAETPVACRLELGVGIAVARAAGEIEEVDHLLGIDPKDRRRGRPVAAGHQAQAATGWPRSGPAGHRRPRRRRPASSRSCGCSSSWSVLRATVSSGLTRPSCMTGRPPRRRPSRLPGRRSAAGLPSRPMPRQRRPGRERGGESSSLAVERLGRTPGRGARR